MPLPSELEEFGLEVEPEHEPEQASLLHADVPPSPARHRNGVRPFSLVSTPSKEQRSLLQSSNGRGPARFLKPGILKWAALVLALAVVAFVHLGRERDEAASVEASLPDVEACEDDPDFSRVIGRAEGAPGNCQEYLRGDDRPTEARCDQPIGIPDEEEFQKLLKHFCRKSCGLCGTEDEEGGASLAAIAKEVEEVAGEIAAKEREEGTAKEGEAAEGEGETKEENDEGKKGSTDGDFGTFTLERLRNTRRAATELVAMLEEYYFGEAQAARMMLGAWLRPWDFDDPDGPGAARNAKVVDTVARALVTDDQTEFSIGTIGSSVAAGHDNCHYDSYEEQLLRTFGPVWDAAGMTLVAQNAGEGGGCGDDYRNQAYCVAQNVAPDVDVVHYTWTYFEEGDHFGKYQIRESLARWTQMLPKQPPVHVLSVLWLPKGGDLEKERELADHYAAYGYNAFYMRSAHTLGGYDYEADKAKGIDHYANGFVGDGYHNVTRYGADEENPNRRESLSVLMRNWHPGPLGFELVSDTFAYVYSKAMLEALDLIEAQMTDGKDPRETWSASKRAVPSKESLPAPKHCDPTYCVVDGVPGCLNFEKPTFGVQGATVEDAVGENNPHKGEVQNWKVWYQDIDMWHMVGKQDKAIFQKREDKEICRHLDQCGGISATSAEDGTVVFRLPEMKVGLIAICGCCGKTVAQEMFLNNNFLEVSYNGAVLNRTEWDIFPNGKCVRLQEKFTAGSTAAEAAYLSVKALEGLSEPVRISHVITL